MANKIELWVVFQDGKLTTKDRWETDMERSIYRDEESAIERTKHLGSQFHNYEIIKLVPEQQSVEVSGIEKYLIDGFIADPNFGVAIISYNNGNPRAELSNEKHFVEAYLNPEIMKVVDDE